MERYVPADPAPDPAPDPATPCDPLALAQAVDEGPAPAPPLALAAAEGMEVDDSAAPGAGEVANSATPATADGGAAAPSVGVEAAAAAAATAAAAGTGTVQASGEGAGTSQSSAPLPPFPHVDRGECEVTWLGTASSQPSKYRNVSATYVDLFGRGALLVDCGEDTFGQLVRRWGGGTFSARSLQHSPPIGGEAQPPRTLVLHTHIIHIYNISFKCEFLS